MSSIESVYHENAGMMVRAVCQCIIILIVITFLSCCQTKMTFTLRSEEFPEKPLKPVLSKDLGLWPEVKITINGEFDDIGLIGQEFLRYFMLYCDLKNDFLMPYPPGCCWVMISSAGMRSLSITRFPESISGNILTLRFFNPPACQSAKKTCESA